MSIIDAQDKFTDEVNKALTTDQNTPLWLDDVEHVAITPAAQELLADIHGEADGETYASFLILLLASGDFGAVERDDRMTNMHAIKHGGMVMGVYPADPKNESQEGNVIWLIVDPGHKILTVLTPNDY